MHASAACSEPISQTVARQQKSKRAEAWGAVDAGLLRLLHVQQTSLYERSKSGVQQKVFTCMRPYLVPVNAVTCDADPASVEQQDIQ